VGERRCQFLRTKPTLAIMLRFVVLALAVAGAAAEATPSQIYAGGLAYGHAYAGYPAGYAGYAAPAYAGYAAAPVAAAPVAAAVPVAHAGLGLPEAATYALPPPRTVAEAPIVEQYVEPVEQWGYKVAY